MNGTSTYFFIYENDSLRVKDVLFPVFDDFKGLEALLPMEKPSEEAVNSLNSMIENL
ncbi:MAG: hypothetical protein ACOCVX_01955 [Bacteroidales bacterium]|jgi:hypothetical protein